MPNNPDIELSSPVTVEAWNYPINSTLGTQYILQKGNDYAMYLEDTGKLRFVFNSHVGTSNSTIPSNQWTHIAITCHSTVLVIYILTVYLMLVLILESLHPQILIHCI